MLALLALACAPTGCAYTEAARAATAAKGDRETNTPVARADEWWVQRHVGTRAAFRSQKPRLLFVGDSITQGWEGAGAPLWDQYYAPRNAVNLGIGGDRTQHVLWRLDDLELARYGSQAAVAVVMIGTNNAGQDEPADVALGVEAVVRRLTDALPELDVLLLAIFPRGADTDDPARRANDQVNERIRHLADHRRVHYLDLGSAFTQADGHLTQDVMPDLLHLSPEGYARWAAGMEPLLAELLEE